MESKNSGSGGDSDMSYPKNQKRKKRVELQGSLGKQNPLLLMGKGRGCKGLAPKHDQLFPNVSV